MNNFYDLIKSFDNFIDITTNDYFQTLPSDWSIFITDIKGSTKAISEGRYKDINTIGAASIVVAKKAMGSSDFPFVFGGDGATLLIPSSKVQSVSSELCALKRLAKDNFDLDLRVGLVRVQDLYDANKPIEVAKYELTPGRCVAVLRGEGVNQAEVWIKQSREKYEVFDNSLNEADLSGLTCRWKPIPSKRGRIFTLIVSSRKGDSVYKKILTQMETFFPEGLDSLNPAITEFGSYKSIWQCMKDEIKYLPSVFRINFFKRFLEIIPAVVLFKYKIPIPSIEKYSKSMQSHSDFRKFDNMLRMVIDCTTDQADKINKLFSKMYNEGDIYYGTFESDNALMTCFVEGLDQGQHIHFIDADGGGYAMAALEMKRQISDSLTPHLSS